MSSTDFTDYLALINRVAQIDSKAASFLRYEAPQLADFSPDDDLDAVLIWDRTPQGYDYWSSINEELKK